MKICIGTANFCNSYGKFNKILIQREEIKKIFDFLIKKKIKYLDTAEHYGRSQELIGDLASSKFNVTSKIKIKKKKEFSIISKLKNIKKKLKQKSIHALLIHNTENLNKENINIFLKELEKLKIDFKIKFIGVSVYDPSDLKRIWKFWKPDIVQIPMNIFDLRFFKSGWLDKLNKNKVKIQVRSVFLQGNLVNDNEIFSLNLKKFSKWCLKQKISQKKACIHFVKKFKKIDYIVMGVSNLRETIENFKLFNQKLKYVPNIFEIKNKKIIDPRRW